MPKSSNFQRSWRMEQHSNGETALVMSHAMGRTLGAAAEQRFYLLGKNDHKQKRDFDFGDFFHLDLIAVEHEGFNVISSEELLHPAGQVDQREHRQDGDMERKGAAQPEQREELLQEGDGDMEEKGQHSLNNVRSYFRKVRTNPGWNSMDCIAAFPSQKGPEATEELRRIHKDMMAGKGGRKRPLLQEFQGKPVPVRAPPEDDEGAAGGQESDMGVQQEAAAGAGATLPGGEGHKAPDALLRLRLFQGLEGGPVEQALRQGSPWYIGGIMCAAARVVEGGKRTVQE
eukprot:CAMPEP_0172579362 /NCGR_PEP_ID=MMETSP1067-20121228/139207_1 /TAXON_ID=265564 ORGANISM="Thalassiosira punctigera, Strain Tpunct2005C2" /NCGR_SAMPLE_ID=MMETSP1067 /ASSEMBLY_ACC=CAM_ASM_000444 /LENGTH=285 /DNA_ID=CAMNT_0013372079 /DNA_START=156 /DNA_END=1017 /DNA_ORIENTATION=+